jgi:hypothetical protein
MAGKEMSRWEKADVLFKGLLPVVVALVGYFGTSYLDSRQRQESMRQFYTELLTKREQADSELRKEMFKYIIDKYLGNTQGDLEKEILGLELLAYNFHESLELAPLFKIVYRKALESRPARADLVARLETLSGEIVDRQVASLAEADHRWSGTIDFQEMKKTGYASVLDRQPLPQPADAPKNAQPRPLNLTLEALAVDHKTRAVKVRLQVVAPDSVERLADISFWVSHFDFPMLDNTRLPNRQRVAVVLTNFAAETADLRAVYFPESRASLKEKPYFDDLIEELKRQR